MKFRPSHRVEMLPPYLFGKLNAIKYERRRQGIDIIDLGMGNPLDPTPPQVVKKLVEAVKDPRNHRYSSATGIASLKREVAKVYQSRYGVKLDAATEIICTIGSKEGFSHMCLAMMGEGDTAIVPQPAFPIHIYAVLLAGGQVIGTPLATEEEMARNIDDLMRNFWPKPKMLIMNFPHNPTTRCVSLEFLDEISRIAHKHKVLVISDLAYGVVTFDGYKAPSFMQTKYGREVGVEFTTMSKEFNMAGWRVGYCVGNASVVEALARVKGYYDYGLFQPLQIASIIAMRECAKESAEQMKRYEKRRDVLCGGLARAGWDVEPPKASMFCWVKIPQPYCRKGSMKFTLELMDKAMVSAAPGSAFGDLGEGYLRLALVENEKRLQQAVRQIRRAFPVKE